MVKVAMTKVVSALAYTAAILIILAAVIVSVGRLMTPYFNQHLPDFETWASSELHTPVSIGDVRITWNLYEPELSFYKVAFLDEKTQKPKIEIQHLTINFFIFKGLLERKLLIENIRVSGATLTARQKSKTQFTLEGFNNIEVTDNLTGSAVEGNQMVSWLFSVPDLYLEDIDLHVISPENKAYFFTIKHLEFANAGSTHSLDGQVMLNQEFQTKLIVHLDLKGAVTDLQHAKAQFYVYLEGVDLLQWLKGYTWKNLQLLQGIGSAKIWGDWDAGTFKKIQTTFQFYSLEMKSILSDKSLVMPRLSGNVGWRTDNGKQTLAGDQIFIDFTDHLWPVTAFSLTWTNDASGHFSPIAIALRYIDLSDVKNILVDSAFLPADVQQKLSALSPLGEIKNFHYKENAWAADFSGISLNAFEKYPGITNLSGTIDWNKNSGNVFLNSQDVSVKLDKVFADPLQFDQITGGLRLQKQENGDWILQTKKLMLTNHDLSASPVMTLTLPAKAPVNINLSADFQVMNVAHISKYLPLKIFDATLQTWLRNAFLSGRVDAGKAILQGNLKDYPFDKGNGKFEIGGSVSDIDLNYAPRWPMLRHLTGTLDFKGRSMTVSLSSGQIMDIPLSNVSAHIPYMGDKVPQILTVNSGVVHTDFTNALRFVHQSPLEETIGKQFSKTELHGPIDFTLGLEMPLKKPETTKVNGHIVMTASSIVLPLWKLTLDGLKGTVDFTEKSVTANAVQGNLFAFPMTFDLKTEHPNQGSSYVVVTINSLMDIPTLETWVAMPLSQYAEGKTTMTATVDLYPASSASHPTLVNIMSDLKGITLKLPEGYGKKADESRPLQLSLTELNDKLQAKLQYANLTLGLEKSDQDWLVDVESQDVSGKISIPRNNTTSAIQGDFTHLYISDQVSLKTEPIDPKKIPPLSFVCQDVHYGDKNIGRVVLNTEPTKSGMTITKLEITAPSVTINATGSWLKQNAKSTSHLQGTINTAAVNDALRDWGYPNSSLVGSKANASFDLTWPDAIYSPTPKGMSGEVTFVFGEGRIVNLSQSSNAQMDLGRLLNIFNLNTIPRRLSGDFSDIQKGYSFDSIKGHFAIDNGNAYTENTRLEGPIAGVVLSGRIGLAAKDFDLNMAVTPYVTSGLPLVAAAAVTGGTALVVGAATWVADKLFVGKEVSKAITHQYHISGTWENPEWKQVGASGS